MTIKLTHPKDGTSLTVSEETWEEFKELTGVRRWEKTTPQRVELTLLMCRQGDDELKQLARFFRTGKVTITKTEGKK